MPAQRTSVVCANESSFNQQAVSKVSRDVGIDNDTHLLLVPAYPHAPQIYPLGNREVCRRRGGGCPIFGSRGEAEVFGLWRNTRSGEGG